MRHERPASGATSERAARIPAFASLRNPHFRLYWAAQLVSSCGTWLSNLALTLLVLHLTHSGVAVGGLGACQYGPILVFAGPAGVITDRVNTRTLLLVTQAAKMLQSAALGVLAFMPHPSLVGLFVMSVVGGMLLAADNPARKVAVNELVAPSDLSNAVALNSAAITVAQVVGPAVAGILVVLVGYGWCFMIDAATYLFPLAALIALRSAAWRPRTQVPPARGQLRDGLRYVARDPTLRIAFVVMLVAGMFVFRWNITLPLLAEQSLGATDRQFTVFYAIFSIGSVMGALVAAHRGVSSLRAMALSTLPVAALLALLAGAPGLDVAFPIVWLTGVVNMVCLTAMNAIVQTSADRQYLGRVVSLQAVVLVGTTPFGGLLLGYVADALGARAPVAVGAVTALVAGAAGLAMLRRARIRTDATATSLEVVADEPAY